MKHYSYTRLVPAVALAVSLIGCQDASQQRLITQVQIPSANEIAQIKKEARVDPTGAFYTDQVKLKVKKEEDLPQLQADMKTQKNIDLKVVDRIPDEPYFLVKVSGPGSLDETISTLKSDQRVKLAAKNQHISAAAFKSKDPLLSMQWSLSNTGQDVPGGLPGKMNADISMDEASEGSYDVIVAIIDTGVDYLHEDLAVTETIDGVKKVMPGSNIWTNPKEIPGNGIDDDNNGYIDDVHGYNFVARNGDPMDDNGHGTHVAGTIGALRNNFKGVAGVVGKVSILAMKFLDSEGGGSGFDAEAALKYLVRLKKDFPDKPIITSNSWGSAERESRDGDEDDTLLAAFYEASQAGILNIVAAGNATESNQFSPSFPANYSTKEGLNLMAVAATNNLDQIADFSSYGYENVQVAAPGVNILSSVPPSKFGGASYAAFSGTSMATPHVSGLAAAIWATDLKMKAEDVKARIMNTVDIKPGLFGQVKTSGRINVKRALANDVNVQVAQAKVVVEVPYHVEAPRKDMNGKYDILTTIEHKGAKEISVCFESIDLKGNTDWLQVLSADYRIKDQAQGMWRNKNYAGKRRELCTAPVLGDTLYLRLAGTGAQSDKPAYVIEMLKVVE